MKPRPLNTKPRQQVHTARLGWRFALHLLCACCLCLSLAASPTRAFAQATPEEKAAAEALFDAGLAALRDGNYPEACEKLEQSQAIEPGIGTLLYLADCYAKVGRTASAWASFREAASAAAAQGQTQRAEAGRQRARELAPTLSRLTVHVAVDNQKLPGIEVQYGGVTVTSELWGVAVPVDPGEHLVRAMAPGHETFEATVKVPPDGASVQVTVPPLAVAAQAVADGADQSGDPASPAGTIDATAAVSTDSADNGDVQRWSGIVIAGAGVVSLGVGAIFGARAFAKNSEAEDDFMCSGATCPDAQGVRASEAADDAATLSNVFVTLGVAMAATGAILYFLAPDSDAPEVAVAAGFAPDGSSGGVSLRGAF